MASTSQGQDQAAPGPRHTYIFDPENTTESARLELQASIVTRGMGGIFPEWDNTLPTGFTRVIDLGCGPGEWVRQVASRSPQASVTGLDVSASMIAFAQARAEDALLPNARFIQGNLLGPLDLPDSSFDLVNERLLGAVLQRDRWPGFLQECLRITRSGGRIRVTEPNGLWRCNQPALERMTLWGHELLHRSGYGFAADGLLDDLNLVPTISTLVAEAGWSEITISEHVVDYSHGSDLHEGMCQNILAANKGFEPIFRRLGIVTAEEFQTAYAAMVSEMATQDFQGHWRFYTICATKP